MQKHAFWGIALALVACTESVPPDFQRLGYAYWPQDSGIARTYWVEEIRYPLVGEPDTQLYYLQERVGEMVQLTEADTTWRLDRYTRPDSTQSWRLDSIWQARRTATQAIVVENNVPRLKLVFPIAEDKTWDGNALHVSAAETYRMQDLGRPYAAGDSTYPSTLRVIQSNNRDTLEMQDFVQEVFAEDLGLVLRESFQFRYCNEDSCFGQQIIEFGRSYRQVLVAHEK